MPTYNLKRNHMPVIDEIPASVSQWFHMDRFWPAAARILRPGGTVAIWGSRSGTAHRSTPNADKINAALEEIEAAELEPYFEPGNFITRNLYQDLGLPWTVQPSVPDFEESTFYRKVFGTKEDPNDTPFFTNEAYQYFDSKLSIVDTLSSFSYEQGRHWYSDPWH